MTDKPKPHISPSSLEMFLRCPERWHRERILGDRPAKRVHQVVGSAVHNAARVNFEFKKATGDDVDLEYLEDAAVQYISEVSGTEGLDPQDFLPGGDIVRVMEDAASQARNLVRVFRQQVAPEYMPNLIEHRFRIPLDGMSHDLLGIIDLAETERDIVMDIKTASKKWSAGDADDSVQATFYDMAYEGLVGRKASEIRFEVITKSKYERQCVRTYRDDTHRCALIYRVKAMISMLDAGVFPPAPSSGAWWCGESQCPHFANCKYTANSIVGVKVPLRSEVGVSIDSPIDAEPLDAADILKVPPRLMIQKIAGDIRAVLIDRHPNCARCNNRLNARSAVLQATDPLVPITIDNAFLLCPVCAIKATLNEEV